MTRWLAVVIVSAIFPAVSTAENLGKVSFPTSCASEVQADIDRAVALLHSFWYEPAEAAFIEIAQKDPKCAMAHWGIAMTAVHPLWPGVPDYGKGRRAFEHAAALGGGTPLAEGYIAAVAKFFTGPEPPDYPARKKAFERAMAELHARYPDEPEVAIFYALALTATAPPGD